MKKSTVIPVLLLAYLAVMSWMGYPAYASRQFSALFYFGNIGLTAAIILFLHINLKRREQQNRNRKR
ncbi:MAG: hypothetical protein K2L49_01980 [Muribaculaceae bacterium]|nr:hypothetical protein [Muribaculaceae bacterium]